MQCGICNTLRGFSACSEMSTAAYSPLPLGMRLHDSAKSKGLRSSLALLSHSSPQTPHLSCSGGLEEPRWTKLHGTYHTAWVTPYSVSCLPLKKRNCHITWNPCFVNRKVRKYSIYSTVYWEPTLVVQGLYCIPPLREQEVVLGLKEFIGYSQFFS